MPLNHLGLTTPPTPKLPINENYLALLENLGHHAGADGAATFALAQHVPFSREVRVRVDRTRLRQHLATLHVFTLRAAQQDTHVVACLTLVEQLAEHFHARAGRLHRRLDPDDFDFFADLHDAALNATRHHRAATRDREHVFHRHQERTVNRALRRRN